MDHKVYFRLLLVYSCILSKVCCVETTLPSITTLDSQSLQIPNSTTTLTTTGNTSPHFTYATGEIHLLQSSTQQPTDGETITVKVAATVTTTSFEQTSGFIVFNSQQTTTTTLQQQTASGQRMATPTTISPSEVMMATKSEGILLETPTKTAANELSTIQLMVSPTLTNPSQTLTIIHHSSGSLLPKVTISGSGPATKISSMTSTAEISIVPTVVTMTPSSMARRTNLATIQIPDISAVAGTTTIPSQAATSVASTFSQSLQNKTLSVSSSSVTPSIKTSGNKGTLPIAAIAVLAVFGIVMISIATVLSLLLPLYWCCKSTSKQNTYKVKERRIREPIYSEVFELDDNQQTTSAAGLAPDATHVYESMSRYMQPNYSQYKTARNGNVSEHTLQVNNTPHDPIAINRTNTVSAHSDRESPQPYETFTPVSVERHLEHVSLSDTDIGLDRRQSMTSSPEDMPDPDYCKIRNSYYATLEPHIPGETQSEDRLSVIDDTGYSHLQHS